MATKLSITKIKTEKAINMKTKQLVAIAIFCLVFILFVIVAEPAKTKVIADAKFTETRLKSNEEIDFSEEINQFAPVFGCAIRPEANPPEPSLPAALTAIPVALDRFRKPTGTSSLYNPKEVVALAAASNYGDRYLKDISGNPDNHSPIIVLHETVGSTSSVINFFQSFHFDEDDQASYHTLIALDGTIVYFVPPDKRAFGAGNSAFISPLGKEATQTNPRYPSSVNNFAYHISFETPEDGMNEGYIHSGYTEVQYQSLAWLVAKTDVPTERITTHKQVDLSGSRIDPRSFNFGYFQKLLSQYPKTREISIGCP